MGILLGLATALSWGSADLCARFATRKIGTFRTMLYMQLSGFLLLTACMPLLGGWGHLMDGSGLPVWAWGILAGLLNTSSTLALYRSFEIGKMSIVAPISASYPVLTMLLSMLTGERITPVRFVGMALTIVGVVLVAHGEKIPNDANPIDEQTQPQKQKSRLGLGALFRFLLRRDVLAARPPHRSDDGRGAFRLDYSSDQRPCNHAGNSSRPPLDGSTCKTRCTLDSRHRCPRYQRLRL